jgi:hypothetical protein
LQKQVEAPKIEDSMESWSAFPHLAHLGFGQHILGTPLGNTLGTHWELEGNKGKMKKKKKILPLPLTQNLK